MKKYLSFMCLLLITISVFLLKREDAYVNSSQEKAANSSITKYKVVIDAGHGGFDPGKVGINNDLEKDVNLSIALKLKGLLEQNDCEVVMTRESDTALYSESDSNKKTSDMRNRMKIVLDADPDITISIHQNSYPEEKIKGAQVFYHVSSTEGKELAEIIQEQLKTTIGDGNHRVAKSNDSYYMLKKSKCPLVIVECGFLSNYKESALLITSEYQDKVAWAIHLGVMNYLNNYSK